MFESITVLAVSELRFVSAHHIVVLDMITARLKLLFFNVLMLDVIVRL